MVMMMVVVVVGKCLHLVLMCGSMEHRQLWMPQQKELGPSFLSCSFLAQTSIDGPCWITVTCMICSLHCMKVSPIMYIHGVLPSPKRPPLFFAGFPLNGVAGRGSAATVRVLLESRRGSPDLVALDDDFPHLLVAIVRIIHLWINQMMVDFSRGGPPELNLEYLRPKNCQHLFVPGSLQVLAVGSTTVLRLGPRL